MDAMYSPVEALALDYLSFGFLTIVNNIWTWVAVITAAVSVWRFKASSTILAPPDSDYRPEKSISSAPLRRLPAARVVGFSADEPASWSTTTSSHDVVAVRDSSTSLCTLRSEHLGYLDGTKGNKFTMYCFRTEEEAEVKAADGAGECEIGRFNVDDRDGDDDEIAYDDGKGDCKRAELRWSRGKLLLEIEMERRMRNLGWYRGLDMAVIDGSVVRLWRDDCKLRRRIDGAAPYCGGGYRGVVSTW